MPGSRRAGSEASKKQAGRASGPPQSAIDYCCKREEETRSLEAEPETDARRLAVLGKSNRFEETAPAPPHPPRPLPGRRSVRSPVDSTRFEKDGEGPGVVGSREEEVPGAWRPMRPRKRTGRTCEFPMDGLSRYSPNPSSPPDSCGMETAAAGRMRRPWTGKRASRAPTIPREKLPRAGVDCARPAEAQARQSDNAWQIVCGITCRCPPPGAASLMESLSTRQERNPSSGGPVRSTRLGDRAAGPGECWKASRAQAWKPPPTQPELRKPSGSEACVSLPCPPFRVLTSRFQSAIRAAARPISPWARPDSRRPRPSGPR